MNAVTLQREFLGRTCAWNEALLCKNERKFTEMVAWATAQVCVTRTPEEKLT